MKLTPLFATAICLFFSSLALAQAIEPVVTKNVHVMQNVTPTQCPTSWRGDASASTILNETGRGTSNYEVATGIRSCDGCAYDRVSKDCVCATCYDNYN
jgi:hypothetical protein